MRRTVWLTLFAFALIAQTTQSEEPRYVVENGVTYLESRVVERRPTSDVRMEDRTETVYKTQYVTELRDQVRTRWVPVTEYIYTPRWQNRWNPFVEPALVYEYRPSVRWQQQTETLKVPVTVQKLIPESKLVRGPVRILGFKDEERVERVAVRSAATEGSTNPVSIASQTTLQPIPSSTLPRPWAAPENSPTLRR